MVQDKISEKRHYDTVQILRLQPQVTYAAVYTYGKTLQSFVFPDLTLKLADIFAF